VLTSGTGALFPGRYCIPFSFDDEQRERQRYDQLAVIARILGDPTSSELAGYSAEAVEEMRNVCATEALSSLGDEERSLEVDAKLRDVCPSASPDEIALLKALLEIDPAKRPSAAAALGFAYFGTLPAVEAPCVTAMASEEEAARVKSAFAFEDEDLGKNELRILLANDLFRFREEHGEHGVPDFGVPGAVDIS
jgi:serine/threonine protein kinase